MYVAQKRLRITHEHGIAVGNISVGVKQKAVVEGLV